MQMKCSKPMAGIFGGLMFANIAAAHPGHAPTDLAAQISHPLAGADHFVAFVVLASVLLAVLRFVLKARQAKQSRS